MNGTGRRYGATENGDGQGHGWRLRPAGSGDAAWRLSVTAVVAAVVAVTGIVFAVLAARSAPSRAASHGATASPAARANAAAGPSDHGAGAVAAARGIPQEGALRAAATGAAQPALASPPVPQRAAPLVLTVADRRDCPAKATACVDLTRHITWLQAGGKTTFGPVAMEPGKPGSGPHATPAGTFHVAWKAGPTYMSTTYNEPMPWATFFAAGGVAFHGGSLTQWSHGCVHLTVGNAHYYNAHLPIGAEVVVF